MIPHQAFSCPHCGAPGMVNMGQAEYSCLCRFNVHGYKKALQEIAAFPPGDFHIAAVKLRAFVGDHKALGAECGKLKAALYGMVNLYSPDDESNDNATDIRAREALGQISGFPGNTFSEKK